MPFIRRRSGSTWSPAKLATHGEVRRGRLGIGIQDLTPDVAEALRLGELRGALIASVEPGSAAAQAGLRTGDVVTAIDNRSVHGATDLRNRIGLTPVGSKIDVTVKRGDGQRVIPVTITSEDRLPADLSGTPFDGARLREASAEEVRQAGVAGVVIEGLASDSVAARSGLQTGDMIVAANRSPPKLGGDADEHIRLALQMLYGTLVNMILHEPGPLSLNSAASHDCLVAAVKAILLYK